MITLIIRQSSSLLWSVSVTPYSLEPFRILGSKFAYLFILILLIHPDMQNGDEGLPNISLAGEGIEMLITLEPHGIY